MKFFIKGFFSKCDQICSFLRIWSHSLKKYLMENFILCVLKADSNLIKNTGNIQIESFPTMINRIMKSVFVFLYLYQPWEHLCFYYIWWNCNTNTSNTQKFLLQIPLNWARVSNITWLDKYWIEIVLPTSICLRVIRTFDHCWALRNKNE